MESFTRESYLEWKIYLWPHYNRYDFDRAQFFLNEGYLIAASGIVKWIRTPTSPNGADHIFGIAQVNSENNTFKAFDPWVGKIEQHSMGELAGNNFFYSYAIKPK